MVYQVAQKVPDKLVLSRNISWRINARDIDKISSKLHYYRDYKSLYNCKTNTFKWLKYKLNNNLR